MRSTPRSTRLISLASTAVIMVVGLVLLGVPRATPAAAAVPAGFQDAAVLSGLSEPTALQFAPDGRVFVAEKNGLIKVFHGLSDTAPTIFADLRTQVHNFWDRGLLGITLDPQFSTGRPYVYVLYTHDAALGGTAPRWGTADASSDGCPNPPGATAAGCVVSGHLSKLTANGDVMAGPEQVLVDGWCQQFPSHSMGTVAFGADGKLYASAGEGANFNYEDHGQTGNPCGDPAGKGGALRAQSLRAGGTPTVLSGSVIRVDPDTGLGSSTNPRWRAVPTPPPGASSPKDCATPSASPSGRGPTRSGPATSGGTPGRRSTGSRTPPPRSATSGGRATRDAAPRTPTASSRCARTCPPAR